MSSLSQIVFTCFLPTFFLPFFLSFYFFLFEGKALTSSWGERDRDHWRKLIMITLPIEFKLRDKRLMVRSRFMLQGFDLTANYNCKMLSVIAAQAKNAECVYDN